MLVVPNGRIVSRDLIYPHCEPPDATSVFASTGAIFIPVRLFDCTLTIGQMEIPLLCVVVVVPCPGHRGRLQMCVLHNWNHCHTGDIFLGHVKSHQR